METGLENNKPTDTKTSSEKIDLATAKKSVLSLVFFPNYIAWVVEDLASKNIVDSGYEMFRTQPFNKDKIQRLEKLIPYLNQPFFKTVFTVSNDVYTLVPTYLFENKAKETYLQLNTGLSNLSLGQVESQELTDYESTLVYNYSEPLYQFINNYSPGAKTLHEKSVLLSTAPQVLGKEGMILNFVEDHFDILLRINSKTVFFNSFKLSSTDDLLYFIYYIAEQYEFDPLQIYFIHTGKIPELVSQKILLKFFPNKGWNFDSTANYNFIASKALLCE